MAVHGMEMPRESPIVLVQLHSSEGSTTGVQLGLRVWVLMIEEWGLVMGVGLVAGEVGVMVGELGTKNVVDGDAVGPSKVDVRVIGSFVAVGSIVALL